MKIHAVGAELLDADRQTETDRETDRQTDRHDEANSFVSQFYESA
jgi:hypothetical protein